MEDSLEEGKGSSRQPPNHDPLLQHHRKDDFGPLVFLVCLFFGIFLFFMCIYVTTKFMKWVCTRRHRKRHSKHHVRFSFAPPNEISMQQVHATYYLPAPSRTHSNKSPIQSKPTVNNPTPETNSDLSATNIESLPLIRHDTNTSSMSSLSMTSMTSVLSKSTVLAAIIEVVTLNRMQKCYLYLQEMGHDDYQRFQKLDYRKIEKIDVV